MIHIKQNDKHKITPTEADIILALLETTYLVFLTSAGHGKLQGEAARLVDNAARDGLRTWAKAKFPNLLITVDDA